MAGKALPNFQEVNAKKILHGTVRARTKDSYEENPRERLKNARKGAQWRHIAPEKKPSGSF